MKSCDARRRAATPEKFATPFADSWGIAIGAQTLFIADRAPGNVDGISTTGLPGSASVLSSAGQPTSLALDATNVYWAGLSGVWFAPRTGGAPTAIVSGVAAATSVTVDATRAYWTQGSDVMTAPKGGGTATSLAHFGNDEIRMIIDDAVALYFIDSTLGQILKLAK